MLFLNNDFCQETVIIQTEKDRQRTAIKRLKIHYQYFADTLH